MLSCESLSIHYNFQPIIKNFSLSMLPGSINVLCGGNGSGKTSLIKAIAGLLNQHIGEIYWQKQRIINGNYPKNALSYLGHENTLKDKLSILENLKFWADLSGTNLLVIPALAHFGLIEMVDLKCVDLSQGTKRKIALARLIIANCQIWLLDEPEAHLDDLGKELLLKLLQVKINNGGIVLIASHQPDLYHKIPKIFIEDFKYAL